MTRLYKLSLTSIAVLALAGGCRPIDDELAEEFRNAVPREETVKMSVPENNGGQALTVEGRSQALKMGETADTLHLTRVVSGVVNGSGAFVLIMVRIIVAFPPSQVSATQAVWGPWADDKAPINWKLTVDKNGPADYSYKLQGQDRSAANAAFITVLSGNHKPALDGSGMPIEGYGSGNFLLDHDARNMLPPERDRHPLNNMPDVGTAGYTYARVSASADVTVDAAFRNVRDDKVPTQRVNLDYRYRQTPGGGGSMEFVHAGQPVMGMTGQTWAVKSRWQQTGAGRSDVRAKGGDIPAGMTATLNECWDTNYASRYAEISWWPPGNYGTEASDCVFPSEEYSSLPF